MKNFNPMPILLFGIMPLIFFGSYIFGQLHAMSQVSIANAAPPQEHTIHVTQDLTSGSGAYIRLSDDGTMYEWTDTAGQTGSLPIERMGFDHTDTDEPYLSCTEYTSDITQCTYIGPTDLLSIELAQ